jgi:hypothetical protein
MAKVEVQAKAIVDGHYHPATGVLKAGCVYRVEEYEGMFGPKSPWEPVEKRAKATKGAAPEPEKGKE